MLPSAHGAPFKVQQVRKFHPTPPGKSVMALKRQERPQENRTSSWLIQDKSIQALQLLQLFLLFLQTAQAPHVPEAQNEQQEFQDGVKENEPDQSQKEEKQLKSCQNQAGKDDGTVQLSYRKSCLIRGSQQQNNQNGPKLSELQGQRQRRDQNRRRRIADVYQMQQGSETKKQCQCQNGDADPGIQHYQSDRSHVISWSTPASPQHQQDRQPPWQHHQQQQSENEADQEARLEQTTTEDQPARQHRYQQQLVQQQQWQQQRQKQQQATRQEQGLHARAEGSNFGAPGKHKKLNNICCVPGQIAFLPRPPSGDLSAVSLATAA